MTRRTKRARRAILLLLTRIKGVAKVNESIVSIMLMFLLKLHVAAFEGDTVTLATAAAKAYESVFILIVLYFMISVMTILLLAIDVVILKQSSKFRETRLLGHSTCKHKHVEIAAVIKEICIIVWFAMKYNIIYHHLVHMAYLTRKLIQGEGIFKTLIANNRYIRELKDTITLTNSLIFIATILINSFTTSNTITRTIGLYVLRMHEEIAKYIIIKTYLLKFNGYLPIKIKLLSQTSAANELQETIIEFGHPTTDYPISDSINTQTQHNAIQGNKSVKQDKTKANRDQYSSCDVVKKLCCVPWYQSPQIPPYILKHYIYIINKRWISLTLSYSSLAAQSPPPCHYSLYLPYSTIPRSLQNFHMPQSNIICRQEANVINSCTGGGQYIYRMKSKPLGRSIIINNENFKLLLKSRLGTAIDTQNLCNLFSDLSFDTQSHKNKTHTEMRQILNDVAGMDHDKYDCLIVAILTHGDYGDVLYGTSGAITIQEIIETFSSKRCPTLIGKPKIFIIQACRGRRYNQAVEMDDENDEERDMIDSGPTVHPNISDYLVAYSTIPGHVSFRNNNMGSIFISKLVKIFRRFSVDEDLTTMLERVTNEVVRYEPQGDGLQNNRQIPEVHSTLRGKVYFNTADKCKYD